MLEKLLISLLLYYYFTIEVSMIEVFLLSMVGSMVKCREKIQFLHNWNLEDGFIYIKKAELAGQYSKQETVR